MKSIKKIAIFFSCVGIALIVGLVAILNDSQRAAAQRNNDCNTANLAGTYVTGMFGTIAANNPVGVPAGPFNASATLVHYSNGEYTYTSKSMYNGTLVDEEFSGTYTVAEGCRVTYYYQGAPAVYAVFTGNRKEARAIWIVPGYNVSGLTVRY